MVTTALNITRIVRTYVRKLEATISVEKVILYGSHARGTPHEHSDIDLAVISPDFEAMGRASRQSLLGRAVASCDPRIEARGYSVREYEAATPATFLGEIRRTGRVVYEAGSHRRAVRRHPVAEAIH